jgi:hypothetical protein
MPRGRHFDAAARAGLPTSSRKAAAFADFPGCRVIFYLSRAMEAQMGVKNGRGRPAFVATEQ